MLKNGLLSVLEVYTNLNVSNVLFEDVFNFLVF